MPKIFEYLGILIFFYSNEHEPIHVHAKKGECESKAEFYIINGVISEVKITSIRGIKPLVRKELKDFEVFLEKYGEKIVEKWINYFVYHKDVDFERISKRLK
jgi:predicted HAD superfamily hydrolase